MELITAISGRITSTRKLLISVILMTTIAMLMVSVFSGCTKKEETPLPETKQLVIPSDLEPGEVLPIFGGQNNYFECVYEVGKESQDKEKTCVNYIRGFVEGELEKDFIGGYLRSYAGYTLKGGKQIGVAQPLLEIYVLKYGTSEMASQAFKRFDKADDLIIGDVKIKGVEKKDHPGSATYMLYSNSIIIWVSGNIEAGRDAISKIIELYAVPIISNNQIELKNYLPVDSIKIIYLNNCPLYIVNIVALQ